MSRPAAQMRNQPASKEEVTEATIAAGDKIANEPRFVEIGDGREVEIRRCKVMQISRVLRLVSDFFGELEIKRVGDIPQIDLQNPSILLKLFAGYAEQVFEVASNLTSLTKEEMQELEMDDAILIVREVWLLNQSFFLQKILPLVQGLIPVGEIQAVEDDGSLSPKKKSTKTSSTTSSSSSGTGSRKRKRKNSQ